MRQHISLIFEVEPDVKQDVLSEPRLASLLAPFFPNLRVLFYQHTIDRREPDA